MGRLLISQAVQRHWLVISANWNDPAAYVADAEGEHLGPLDKLLANPVAGDSQPHFLAPCDLRDVKACGVTFAGSMVERVIQERAAGDPSATSLKPS